MTKNYLLEIGLEEMPAHVVKPSIDQLVMKTSKFLQDNGLSFKEIKPFSTPRRLALIVEDLAEKQDDIDEVAKGPAKKIAYDADGNFTKAAMGFARGQGMTTDDIYFDELKGVEYAYIHIQRPGKTAQEILPGIKDVITSLTFKTRMRWADYDLEYIRPIHSLVSLLDDEVIEFSILDVKSGRHTRGHRFLGDQLILATAMDYEDALKNEFVIADAEDRKNIIRTQIEEIAANNNWVVNIDENLLDEVTNLVEFPTVFAGGFDEKYLSIPKEVLITSMKDNQRYFEVYNQDGELINHFISVRNGNRVHLDNVILGNEKVLVARLDDAKFFYEEDQKVAIDHYVHRLKTVSFHDKIGSIYEKMQRVQKIGDFIGKKLNLSDQVMQTFRRASEIYKFDLVTGMVGEFPELQGIMGERYALLAGEDPAVATAIREQYLPTSSEGKLPADKAGALLALSDKLDTVLTFFGAKMIPTSSNDPYALRRYTYGIVRILIDRNWSLDLKEVLPELVKEINSLTKATLPKGDDLVAVGQFTLDRMKQFLQANNFSFDVIDSVLASVQNDPIQIYQAAKTLQKHHNDPEFKPVVEALTRINNLLAKADKTKLANKLDAELFEHSSEAQLAAGTEVLADFTNFEDLYQKFVEIRPLIDTYFAENMIMAPDEAVQANRLSQLSLINKLSHQLGDLSQLVIK